MAEEIRLAAGHQQDQTPTFDGTVRAPVSIEVPHNMIHRGLWFEFSHSVTLDDQQSADLLVVAGANEHAHLSMDVEGGASGLIEPFRGADYSDPGTAVGVYGNNAAKTNPDDAATAAYHTPTLNADGTALPQRYMYGGEKKGVSGGGAHFPERIVPPGGNMLLRVTNDSGNAAITFWVYGAFYELTSG